MAKRKRVTEEDIHITEALIAESFGRLKASVTRAPSQAIRPVTSTIKEHPLATVAMAAGAGLTVYELIRQISPRVVVKEIQVQPQVEVRGAKGRSDLTAQLLTLAAPYIAGYLQQYLGKLMSGERQKN